MSDAAPQQDPADSRGMGQEVGADELLESGGAVPGLARPAFTLQRAGADSLPVLIAVPHAGRAYPPDAMQDMRHGEAAAHRLEDRFVDLIARAAAAACGAGLLIAHAPRALIDLNRDTVDLDDGMFAGAPPGRRRAVPGMPHQQPRAPRGLGLFPRRLNGMGEIWRRPMSADEAERRIAAIHMPYHAALAAELDRLRERHGHAMLIDLHSMPSLPGRVGMPGASHVVGDRFGASCASALAAAAMDLLGRSLALPAYNRPYAGGYVLDRHGRPRRNIHAIQLEIDRARYLDNAGRPDEDGVAAEGRIVGALAQVLAMVLTGEGWTMAEAAE